MANSLLDFGIAINFFGNYNKEGAAVEQMAERINHSLTALKHLVIGGLIVHAFGEMKSALWETALELEKVYAKLMTVFGNRGRVNEHFAHAREFVAANPYMNLEQVHEGTTQLAIQGLANTADQANRNLKYLGDFSAGKGLDFQEGITSVVNALNGNWEMLSNRGVRQSSLATLANNAKGNFTDTSIGADGKSVDVIRKKSEAMKELLPHLVKAKQGTEEYSSALIKFLGVMEAGGMENASKTIGGSLNQLNNLFTIFKLEIVGASQELGTLSNKIGTTLHEIAAAFQTRIHAIERIGAGLGHFISDIFSLFTGQIGSATKAITGYIDRLDAFFTHYEQNIAPIVLFLALVKIQIEEFLSGFIAAFKPAFMFFIQLGVGVYEIIGGIANWLGIGTTKAETFGKILGAILGTLLGIKAFKLLLSPFASIIGNVISFSRTMWAAATATWAAISSAWTWIATMAESFVYAMLPAIVAVWDFTAALLANPMTWVVLAIIALVSAIVYMIFHWDKVKAVVVNFVNTAKLYLEIMWAFIKVVGRRIADFFIGIWTTVKGAFVAAFEGIKDFFVGIWDGIEQWFMDKINSIIGWFKDAWGEVKSWFGMEDEIDAMKKATDDANMEIRNPQQKQVYQMYMDRSGFNQTPGATYQTSYGGVYVTLPNVTNPKEVGPALDQHLKDMGKQGK